MTNPMFIWLGSELLLLWGVAIQRAALIVAMGISLTNQIASNQCAFLDTYEQYGD